jgi:type VI protein secretion system component VasK
MVLAVGTGVVVIVIAVAVVLVVLFVTLSLRQRRNLKGRRDLVEAHERAARAERDLEIAQEQAQQRTDPDR